MKSLKISLSIGSSLPTVIHHLNIISHERGDFSFSTGIESQAGLSYQSIWLRSCDGMDYPEMGIIRLREMSGTKTDLTVFDPMWKETSTQILCLNILKKDELKYLQETGKLDRRIDLFEEFMTRRIKIRDEIISNLENALRKDGVLERNYPEKRKTTSKSNLFVSTVRIKQLRAIKSSKYDLKKLVRLCEELNYCFEGKCYLAVAILVRTILDHVPPIFGDFKTFTQVANSYGGPNIERSLKEVFQKLDGSARGIADYHIHMPASAEPSLPNKTQVNYSQELDFLLGEIIRMVKKDSKAK